MKTTGLPQAPALHIRPVALGDEAQHLHFLAHVDAGDLRRRIFATRRGITAPELTALVNPDPALGLALVATRPAGPVVTAMAPLPEELPAEWREATLHLTEHTLGVARAALLPSGADEGADAAELGILIRSDCQGQGIGQALMAALLAGLRKRGLRALIATMLADNQRMVQFLEGLGFSRDDEQSEAETTSYTLLL